MYRIDIADSQDCLTIETDFLQQVVERVLAEEEVANAEVSVALVDDATIHELNRRYLNHDYATDVLSFLLDCEPADEGHQSSPTAETFRGRGKRIDGEVIISTETAQRDAENFGWSPREEVVLYLIHGILHLVGYDDLSETEQTVMRARERAMLALFDITPPSPDSPGEFADSPSQTLESDADEEPERPSPDGKTHSRRLES